MLSTIILTKSDFWPLSLTTHLRFKFPDNPDTDARTHARTHKHRTKKGTATFMSSSPQAGYTKTGTNIMFKNLHIEDVIVFCGRFTLLLSCLSIKRHYYLII